MSVGSFNRPLWKEGMFLAPQHMQQYDNYRDSVEAILLSAAPPYAWGIKSLDIDTNQFSNFYFSINELLAITNSKEVLCFPGNIKIPSRTFDGLFVDPQQKLLVFLGIPDYEKNSSNLDSSESEKVEVENHRYVAVEKMLSDENTGDQNRAIEMRMIKGRIFFEGEDTQGYSLLPIARLRPAPNMNGALLDDKYAPPLLQLSAWPPLQKSIQGASAKLAALQSNLMKSMGSKKILEWCNDPRGVELVFKVQAVNQAFFVLNQIAGTNSLAPFDAYCEILRAVGLLWAFKGDELINKIPFYDHIKLDTCFGPAIDVLRKLISMVDVQSYINVKFTATQGRMEVDLESAWFTRKIYVRITGAGEYADVISKMSGLKVCAPSHFGEVLQRRIQALQLRWLKIAPSGLPASKGSVYAELVKGGPFWPGVEKEQALALGVSTELPFQFDLFVE